MIFRRLLLLVLGILACRVAAQTAAGDASRYRITFQDVVRLAVQGEPEVAVDRRIDASGEVNLPLLGQVKISGLTVAEAQELIAKRYVDEEIFIRPQVVVSMIEYSLKEVMVLGQINRQGKLSLPPEAVSMSIVEIITSAGGFNRIAKGDAVRVTRRDENGVEQTITVNVEKLIGGRGASGETFMVQPGDVVFVPERVF